ncbi:MAG: hypothetical protein AAGF79_00485 [Pseudomonadota bacterium]
MSVEAIRSRRRQLTLPAPTSVADSSPLPWLVVAFLICIFVPFQMRLGPLQMSTIRFVLLLLLIPMIRMMILSPSRKLIPTDIFFALLCFWVTVSMTRNHGFLATIEYNGIFAIETLGGYLVGRVFIRGPQAFEKMVRVYFGIVFFLFPFALIETLTGYNVLLHLSNAILYSQPEVRPLWRLGFERVQATLDHPIHFGIIMGSMLGLTFKVMGFGVSTLQRYGQAGLVFITAFFAMSTGAILMMATQIALLSWDAIMKPLRERWKVLLFGVLGLAVFEMTTGAVIQFLINNVAFNPDTAFNRTRIFGYTILNIERSPIFGIGLNEWINMPGTTDSVDMFWMLLTMMHGIPAGIFLILAFVWLPVTIGFRPVYGARLNAYKTGYLIAMTALFIVMWTVHAWRELYVFICFLLGSGSWLLDVKPPGSQTSTAAEADADPDAQDGVPQRSAPPSPTQWT